MNDQAVKVFVNAVCAFIEACGAVAQNNTFEANGLPPPFDREHFQKIMERYELEKSIDSLVVPMEASKYADSSDTANSTTTTNPRRSCILLYKLGMSWLYRFRHKVQR